MKVLRKMSFIIAILVLCICTLAISVFAAFQRHLSYYDYELEMAGARLGTSPYLYSSVGYRYLNAVPDIEIPNAYFTVSICSYEKEHWASLSKTWVNLATYTATMNSPNYWGAGIDGHNNGQDFSFRLIPYNHVVDGGYENPSISYSITIEEFHCESSE